MSTKHIVLKAGEKTILPRTARVKAVIVDGSVTVSSSCGALPDPTGYICYKFKWQSESSTVGSGYHYSDLKISHLVVGENEYTLPTSASVVHTANNSDQAQEIQNWINAEPVLKGLVKCFCANDANEAHEIIVAVPEGLPVPELKFFNTIDSGGVYFFQRGEVFTGCSDCNAL